MGEETVDGLEAKYVSGLSTIMVATIQEAKDRISQIEYIFCSQLYPNFQSKSRIFEKVYSEARLKACDAWKEREKTLLSEIEELKLENQRVKPENLASEIEEIKLENLALTKDKEKLSEELDKLVSMPFRLKSLEDYIVKLKLKSKKRSDQVQICIQLHSGLVEVLRVKGSDELNEDEVNMLLSEVKSLKVKAEELSKKTLVTENLLKKLEHLSTEAAENERKLSSLEEEKQRLTTRLQLFEENVDRLQKLLMQKDALLKEGKMALDLSRCKLYATNMEMLGCKKNIVAHEKEKLGFMGEQHRSYLADLEALRRQSEEKSSELAMEVKKRKDAHSAYKKLKSQYNFLCKKFGLTTDSVPLQSELEDDTNQTGQHERPAISNSLERKHSETANGSDKAKTGTDSSINCEKERIIKTLQTPTTSISPIAVEKKHKETVRTGTGSSGSCEKESIIKTVQTPTTSVSPILPSPGVRNGPSSAKSPQLSGSKRPASIWRDTRSRQSPGGHDPHDDFLDTPIENVKRVAGEEKQIHDAAKKDDSDDETQDLNPKPSPSRQRIQVAETSKKGFKHVEPVRKKAERENLKGIECKQCKKFYDAVLPENEGNGKSLRCEHHEGVSRHRYKYAPPMTPEGFWNIGFESEM